MKRNKNHNLELSKKIELLKQQRTLDYQALSDQLNYSYQEMKPSKLVSRAFDDIKGEPKIKANLLETSISIAGGYLSKKILIGKSKGLMQTFLAYGVQYLSSRLISKNLNLNKSDL